MPGCKIYSIHACVLLLVLSVCLSLAFSHLFVSSVLQVLRALCSPLSLPLDVLLWHWGLLVWGNSPSELPGLPRSHNFILGKFLSFPGDKTRATFALTWIISEGIEPCFVMKVSQGGWWGMRIPSDGNSWQVSESRCLHLSRCRIVLISFLVHAEKYMWQAEGERCQQNKSARYKIVCRGLAPALTKRGKKRGKGKKKTQPQLCIYSSYQTVTDHHCYSWG